MNVEFINPFLESTAKVIETMAFTKVTPGKPGVKQGNKTWGVVSGIIGLAGEKATGNLILSFDEPSILGIVSSMLGEEFSSISPDVVDAVGEITNMVSGSAKAMLNEKGFVFDMATPLMIVGQDMELSQLSKEPVIAVPFRTEKGKFVVEAMLRKL